MTALQIARTHHRSKTGGQRTPNDWIWRSARLASVPLYAVPKRDVAAVAFANEGRGDESPDFRKEQAIPGVRPAKSWSVLMQY